MLKPKKENYILEQLGLPPFSQRFPWIGGDLQTLRDTFIDEKLYLSNTETVQIAIPSRRRGDLNKEHLIAFINYPLKISQIKGLVLMVHGLGGSSRRRGLRRMAGVLINAGFAVMRLNLRGADPGRNFAAGTYSASCNSDIFPALEKAREISNSLSINEKTSVPLFGVGISLGGTILLNACLDSINDLSCRHLLDALVCISSPLDLAASSTSIERTRNSFYQKWLLNRLIKQTLNDPFGISDTEREALIKTRSKISPVISSIKDFDSVITSPRWGFKNVDDYYKRASPIHSMWPYKINTVKNILLIHSLDDPWVPSEATENLYKSCRSREYASNLEIVLTNHGGHNGFHSPDGCWGDDVVKCWLLKAASHVF